MYVCFFILETFLMFRFLEILSFLYKSDFKSKGCVILFLFNDLKIISNILFYFFHFFHFLFCFANLGSFVNFLFRSNKKFFEQI